MAMRERWMESPIGWLRLFVEDGALVGVFMEEHARAPASAVATDEGDPLLDEAARQLAAWFAGERISFDLPLRPRGTPFQIAVWQALREIPYAETRSYLEIAAGLGQPKAVRAVGAANGRNPLGIVVPCHRVIGANGALTGYAGGLERKRWLLGHERQVLGRSGQGVGTGAQGCLALAPDRRTS
ncbi:MAG: cysteine methyltransferase [Anaeromyxobacter sp. RBG_16_69_14]|nr:MAG: cysteine methyltransferase [Anaeromyxobacter sp. RBG_16_69_14]